ncbi:MAG TPA: CpsD/CapB family tyrosine-protein kinase [Candidatus Saccharimonadales bacterium]|jgi:capsular exopolysaccharide synthesis family protein|nr:CpsD/CapB family tyrosine-protein kinase [Candidatus Saccharimonadales bacterium]
MEKDLLGLTHNLPAASPPLLRGLESLPSGMEELTGQPLSLAASPRLAAVTAPESVGAENFRVLAARLRYFQEQRRTKKLVVTSCIKGEGKSVVSANLALTLARRQRTLLIDGDLRQSGLGDLFGSHSLNGITDWWLDEDENEISDLICPVDSLPLWYLPVGQAGIQPLEILQSKRMSEMLEKISPWFSWIVIDSPPLAPFADPSLWATHADGTLLVVRQGKTPKKLLLKTLEDAGDLKLVGVVVNASKDSGRENYRQYYKTGAKSGRTARAVDERRLPRPGSPSLPSSTK